jgi:hypothetical protein
MFPTYAEPHCLSNFTFLRGASISLGNTQQLSSWRQRIVIQSDIAPFLKSHRHFFHAAQLGQITLEAAAVFDHQLD